MRPTHHPVAALVFGLAALDAQTVQLAGADDVILVSGVQFMGAFVPGETDLRIVDPDPALKDGALVLRRLLVADVLDN